MKLKFLTVFLCLSLLFLREGLALNAITFGKKGTVLLFVASHCPCSEPHRLLVQTLAHHFKNQIHFNAIFSNKFETEELAKRFMRQTGWDFSWIIDREGRIQEKYKATRTPEVLLLNTKKEIVYRGAIDDSVPNLGQMKNPYLEVATKQLLNGKEVDPKETTPYGCYIVH